MEESSSVCGQPVSNKTSEEEQKNSPEDEEKMFECSRKFDIFVLFVTCLFVCLCV